MSDDIRPPKIENAPGLAWKKHKYQWEARWQARSDLVKDGYPVSVVRLWLGMLGPDKPNEYTISMIRDRCNAMQDEMYAWANADLVRPIADFNGTVSSLIYCFKNDKLSRYQKLRFVSRRNYNSVLKSLDEQLGKMRLENIKTRTIHELYSHYESQGHISMAHSVIGMLRGICSYGVAFQDDTHCLRLCTVLGELRFANGAPRTERLEHDQVLLLREEAHKTGWHSIALAQAFQFYCILRQKDVIGEYVPISEPVPSVHIYGNEKWIRGLDWKEIDENFVLRHMTSKRNKPIVLPLRRAAEVMEELAIYANTTPDKLTREMLPTSGPVIVHDNSKHPWAGHAYRVRWRDIARRCDIPDHVRNMDSRAGGISEAIEGGASLEHVRHAATHSDVSTTTRYDRGAENNVVSVMDKRAEYRTKKGT